MNLEDIVIGLTKLSNQLSFQQKVDIATLVIGIIGTIIYPLLFLFFFNKREKNYQQKIDKELEAYKVELSKELENLKIEKEHLQKQRIDETLSLIEDYFLKMFDKQYVDKISKNKTEAEKFAVLKRNIGMKLFLFASDEAVKRFVKMEKIGKSNSAESHGMQMVLEFAELLTQIRRDMGYPKTECNRDDILSIILTDWDKYKDKVEVKSGE